MPTADEYFMEQALAQGKLACDANEVPIGAVLVSEQQIIASAHNSVIKNSDPTAHAEMLVMRQAGLMLQNYRLINTTLYVTIEPCAMCLMAMIHARIKRLVFASNEPKTGAVNSAIDLQALAAWNHKIVIEHGVKSAAATKLMQDFFKARR
jgi:tRNA(adenine34) deaminase